MQPLPANGEAGQAGSPGSWGMSTLTTVGSQHNGAPAMHHAQGSPPDVADIPPNPQSPSPPPAPTQRSLRHESILSSLSPTPSSLWSTRTSTSLSTATSLSPGPEPQNSHSSPAKPTASVNKPPGLPSDELYGTATIQKLASTQQQFHPQPAPLNNTSYIPTPVVQAPSSTLPQQAQKQGGRSWIRRTVEYWFGEPPK